MSVAEISSTLIYDQITFQPNFHAINDPRMGVMDKDSLCYTCKAGMEACPGHFGHIALHSPIYHPGLLTYLVKILRTVCFNCSKLLIHKEDQSKFEEHKEKLLK
jgi:DNA-directed RNA polymerase II subunit RPB1